MFAGTSIAVTLIRVPRGAPAPGGDECRRALNEDLARLGVVRRNDGFEVEIRGPYPISVADHELDEYVVWER
jgi:hypothetical protein